MTLEQAQPEMMVIYVPRHAEGDRNHKDCETGVITSKNARFVFVKFVSQMAKFGREGTTAQACSVEDLVWL